MLIFGRQNDPIIAHEHEYNEIICMVFRIGIGKEQKIIYMGEIIYKNFRYIHIVRNKDNKGT